MTSVKIPDDVKPTWKCSVNGKKYSFPAGATMDVPDEVAALIGDIIAAEKQPDAPYVPALPAYSSADEGKVLKISGGKLVWAEDSDAELPAVTSTDNGKVLKVASGKWAVGTDATGDTLPTVTGDDDGKVLKVIDGAWGVGTDETTAAETTGD